MDLTGARVMVTGGGGFLGRRIVQELEERGATPIVIRSADYDLTEPERVRAALQESQARVRHPCGGGRGWDRGKPGAPRWLLLRECRDGRPPDPRGVARRHPQARDRRNRLLVSQVHGGALPRRGPVERVPGGDECPVRASEEDAVGAGAGLS